MLDHGWQITNSWYFLVSRVGGQLNVVTNFCRVVKIKGNCNKLPISISFLDVNWLIPKISTCRARIWSLLASERSERITICICCRAGWYLSISILFTSRWHAYHPYIKHKHGYIYLCIFAGNSTWFKIFKIRFPKTVVHK
jgi:hypothetical protein